MKFTRRSFPSKFALSIMLAALMPLASCSTPSGTPTQPLTPPAMVETATATATAEAAGPNMDSIPAEWRDKVSKVVTLPDGRIVALEKLTAEEEAAGLKPQLRELQWDKATGEWIPYVPQVGLIDINSEYWDKTLKDGQSIRSDDMTGPELAAIAAEPIYGKDGQEIKPGLVADFSDYTLFCGDIIETHQYESGNGVMVIRVPKATGDLELFFVPYVVNYGEGVVTYAYDRDTIDPSLLVDPLKYQSTPMGEVITEYPMGLTPKLGKAYQEGLAEATPVRMVFAVSKTATSAGGADSTEARRGLIDQWLTDNPFDADGVKVWLDSPAMVPEAEYQP